MSSGAIPNFDDYKPKQIKVTGDIPAFDAYVPKSEIPADDHNVRQHLKDEGFLESAWKVIKSPVALLQSLASGDYAKEGTADYARMQELQKSGTPEQKRAFAKEIILKNIPGASTVYKATHGNLPGAAGDVLGAGVLGGIAKAPEIAESPVGSATGSFARGAAETLNNAPSTPVTKNVGRALGYGAGKLLTGDYAGGVATGVIGGEVGPKVAALPAAIRTGLKRAVETYRQETAPPRPAPAWQNAAPAPETPVAAAPVQAAQPPALPSGRTVPPADYVPPRATSVSARRPAPVQETPGQVIARESGQDWAKLSPPDRAMLEQVAKARQNTAAQTQSPPLNPEPGVESTQPGLTPAPVETPAPAPPVADLTAVSNARTPAELAKAAGLPEDATPAQIARAIHDSMQARGALPTTQPPAGSGVPDPTPLADLMRDVPNATRKAVAKSNYRAVKEGQARPETAGPTYEAANRAIKVSPVAKAILDNGFTYSDMTKLTKPEIESYVNQLSAATAAETGAHPGNVFSQLSVDELLGELRRAEKAMVNDK